VATTNSSAWSLKVDNVVVAPSKYVYGTPITDWVDYTPSWTSSGTQPNIGNGSVTGKWRRVGDSIECQVRVLAGSTTTYGTGTYLLSLPQGLSFDTSKFVDGGDDQRLGYGSIVDQGNNRWFFFVNYRSNSSNRVVFIVSPDGTSGFVTSNSVWSPTVPFTFGNGDVMAAFFSGPIQGWSSSVKMSDGYDGRDIAARYQNDSGGTVASGALTFIDFNTQRYDFTNSVVGAGNGHSTNWQNTWRYIVPVSGLYSVKTNVTLFFPASTLSSLFGAICVNGNQIIRGTRSYYTTPSATEPRGMVITGDLYLKAGDAISVGVLQDSGAARTIENGAPTTISIHRISSPQTIAMGEVVAARYSTASGQSIPINTYTTVNFNTKEYDTHNAVTTGTNWVFTAPVAGIYNVSFRLLYNFFSMSAPLEMPTALYKNNNYFCEIGRMTIPTGGNVYPSMGGSADIQLNAGDTISIRANNFTGAARNLLADSGLVWVSIHKIS
jgi:hypothetical protein